MPVLERPKRKITDFLTTQEQTDVVSALYAKASGDREVLKKLTEESNKFPDSEHYKILKGIFEKQISRTEKLIERFEQED